jgi:DNA-binding MarR family transcriptional regulator
MISGRPIKIMDHDERIYTVAEDMSQTIPLLYRWILRPDVTGISAYSPMISVMRVVNKQGPISMSSIAQALYYSKQNLTSIVDNLVREGYVERMPDPSDRRVLNIALTEQGKAFMAERKKRIKSRLVEDLSHLSEEELEHLSKAFEEVKLALPKMLGNEVPDQTKTRTAPRPMASSKKSENV